MKKMSCYLRSLGQKKAQGNFIMFFSYYLRGLGQKLENQKRNDFLWFPEVGPHWGGEEVGTNPALPRRLPLEIRNHDSSHLVKKLCGRVLPPPTPFRTGLTAGVVVM